MFQTLMVLKQRFSDPSARVLSCNHSEKRFRLYFEGRSSFNEDIKTINSSKNNTVGEENHIIKFLCRYLLPKWFQSQRKKLQSLFKVYYKFT